MTSRFQELAWGATTLGELSLRRRTEPTLGVDIYEVKLDAEYLMSSLFTVGEAELARLGLAPLAGVDDLDVAVGGLGLGYTARAVQDCAEVRSLVVVDALAEMIDWHHQELMPLSRGLTTDPRCRLVHADFFALDFDPGRRFHAILCDIDHSPRHLLDRSNASFYTAEGMRRVRDRLHPGGAFALWSNDPPDDDFTAVQGEVFASSRAHVVTFPNPLQGRDATNTVYVSTVES